MTELERVEWVPGQMPLPRPWTQHVHPDAHALARKLAGAAADLDAADDLRDVLEALGLLQPTKPQPKQVPAHDRHSRSAYVPGCHQCRDINRAYIRAYRARHTRITVTAKRTMKPQQLTLWS